LRNCKKKRRQFAKFVCFRPDKRGIDGKQGQIAAFAAIFDHEGMKAHKDEK